MLINFMGLSTQFFYLGTAKELRPIENLIKFQTTGGQLFGPINGEK